MLYKLHHDCGIRGNLYYMLRALLKGRTMQVVYNNLISLAHALTAGVPQGSVLAPLQFLIFIHALATQLSPVHICDSLFADDVALLPRTSGTAGLVNLRLALDVLTEYAMRWKINFSKKKTQVVFCTPHITRRQPPPSHSLASPSTPQTHTPIWVSCWISNSPSNPILLVWSRAQLVCPSALLVLFVEISFLPFPSFAGLFNVYWSHR